ncbi:MAG: RagB/SusD family nutrient uptake outer membrane protein [Reichenbachiella sp.]|uniref:RagB/SusD family nutrient uptake outer membrane protein n=1 Tax=Reichenbachiella sp. TaxID=2184521 RepID=UPI00326395D1
MRKIKYICLGMLVFISQSCNNDILDLQPQGAISEAVVWNDPQLIELFVSGAYTQLPHGFPLWAGGLRLTSLTDESYHMHQCRLVCKYTQGEVTESNMHLFGGFWRQAYETIRSTNIFLENIRDDIGDPARIAQLTAEIRFLRAFFYIELFSRYGDIPLVTSTFGLEDDFSMDRTPVAEIVSFVADELDLASADLPTTFTGADFGRATKGAAIALKARALLYGASPLFSAEDTEKWQLVADACEELFALNLYALSSDYEGIFFNVSDPEVIFFRQFISEFGWEQDSRDGDSYYYYKGGHNIDEWRMPNGSDGWVGENPLQNLVDKYETIDGEIPVLGYSGASDDLKPLLNPAAISYDPLNPYANRDPRLYYSIIHDGANFQGREIEFWECGTDSRCDNIEGWWNGSLLDYSIRKSVNAGWEPGENENSSTPWIYMRLAEIYLTYAEAQYHLGNMGLAIEYVNRVRSRTGVNMPSIESSQSSSSLLDKIKHERNIELAFESNRWYDARRWRDAEVDFSAPAIGARVIRNEMTGVKSYEYFVQQKRAFPESHYLFPIPLEERTKSGLIQNPGY